MGVEQLQEGENRWGPHVGETQSRAQLVLFDGSGRETGHFNFPVDPPTGGTLSPLVAPEAFVALDGTPVPDVMIPPLLSPAEAVRSRFADVAMTDEPLFVAETVPSEFDPGFDFNLNTLVVMGVVPSPSDAPCTGELRGVITSGSAGRAKVLTRISPTMCLVYGGMRVWFEEPEREGNSVDRPVELSV